MSAIQIGCQFYTWQMSGQRYVGKLAHIFQAVNSAGFAGIEPETCMLGSYYDDPQALKDLLIQYGLKLGALTLVLDWRGSEETEDEKQAAGRLFDFMRSFPGVHLVLCQMPGRDRAEFRQRQANTIACVNTVAARAADRGIDCSFHPNSPPGSIFRIADDYKRLLDGLDARWVGFAPDSGHIANGGMDVVQIFQTYLPLIRHVHFKDISAAGGWTGMGAGVIDFPRIVNLLAGGGYSGWIMVEEESPEAEVNPDAATNQNGKYLHRTLLPLTQELSIPERSADASVAASAPVDHQPTQFPAPGQVRMDGPLSARFQGNVGYLSDVFAKKKAWMLEPFRKRGQEWIVEPRRGQKGELAWAGEYAGKWLDAASRAAAGGSPHLRQAATEFAAALIATQEKDGYLGIETPDKRGENSEWDLWNLKYAMTGLLTHFEAFQEQSSLDAARSCAEWLVNHYGLLKGADSPFFHSPEEGGVSAMIVDDLVHLARLTGEAKFLEFASSVTTNFSPVIRMQRSGQAPLLHAYTILGDLGGIVEQFAVSNLEDDLLWVEKVWEDLVENHLYPTGSLGYNELLRKSAPNDTPVENSLPARHHQETCATVEWLLFNSRLYHATGNVRYIETMEQTIYNALFAAQSIEGSQWMYYTPLRYEKRWFSGPTSCCYWSGPRGIARLPKWVYALDDEGLRVNLFESSLATLHLKGRDLTIRQSSQYPQEGRVTLQLQPEAPLHFTLFLRKAFQNEARIRLNGQPLALQPALQGYYPIQRLWSPGDAVEMEFDVPASVRRFLGETYGVLVRGCEILAVDQADNPGIDLDRLALREPVLLAPASAAEGGRRRYSAAMHSGAGLAQVVFTPYADCGNQGSRFRTAFPISNQTG